MSQGSALTAKHKPTRTRRSSTWLDNPQRSGLRRLILKVHLWAALISSVYLIVISATGSAVVMRRELSRWLSPPRFVVVDGPALSTEQLHTIVAGAYPDHTIRQIVRLDDARVPAAVTLVKEGTLAERRFNPYTGEDLGDPFPRVLRVVEWLVDLHDNLLSGETGRNVNGIGGAALLIIVLSGAVLWWPGRKRWLESIYVSGNSKGRRFLWRLHSMLGFWTFTLLMIWALTAMYFAFPGPIEGLIDRLDSDPTDFVRPGEPLLLALISGHFGRFGPLPVRFVWMALGLVPIALFVTGYLLWRRPTRPSG
jgi:uncharacterized iron-regulated membrane protein